jgi:hypothetical protein
MMTRLSFATGLGTGNLPLLNPPFEEEDGGGAPREPRVVTKNGRYQPVNFGGNHVLHIKMEPPDPNALAATFGGSLAPSTASAVEAAPPQLHASLILGSPEFMKR